MPTYDYVCKACNHRFEAFQSMNDELLVRCPSCGEEALHRLIGAGAGLVFKGSGFYLTDYKRSGSSSAASHTSSPTNGTSATSSASQSSDKSTKGTAKD